MVGQAADGDEVSALVDAHGPDVVLMDIRMPRMDGIAATRRLRSRPRPPEVIMLTTFDTDEYVLGALRAGASGFLLKDTPPDQIVAAIQRVAAGDPIVSPAVLRRLMDRIAGRPALSSGPGRPRRRSARASTDVALAVARGMANAEIAAELVHERGHGEGPRVAAS